MILASLDWREPLWLWLAWLPLLQWLWRGYRARGAGRYADPALLPWLRIEQGHGRWQRWLGRDSAWLLGWLLLCLALAGPRHAIELPGSALHSGPTLIAVVDLSRSMEAIDIFPSRRQRATLELFELLEQARDSRIGIIVFAGRAHRYVPPSDDHHALRFYLQHLDRLVLPTHGSAAADALRLARRIGPDGPPGAVVLLSDGDLALASGEPDPELNEAARELAAAGSSLYTLGIGGLDGAAIPLPEGGWLEHEGEAVLTRLNEARLQQLAQLGGGSYHRASADNRDWQSLYADGMQRKLARQPDRDSPVPHTQWQEHYPWLLVPALWLLFVAMMPCGLGRGRPHSPLLLALGLLLIAQPHNPAQADEATPRAALAAYQEADYASAAAYFSGLPGYLGRMGAGASYYRQDDYPAAASQFTQAVLLAEADRQRADALFNLGNSLFQLGDYAAAAEVFADVLRYQPEDPAAPQNQALSEALYHTVLARSDEGELASRAGRGPRSGRAAEGMQFGEASTLSLDDSTRTEEAAIPALPEHAEALIARGIAHLARGEAHSSDQNSILWQQDLAQARLRMQGLREDPAQIWKSLFEREEGFAAPQETPRELPGVRPW